MSMSLDVSDDRDNDVDDDRDNDIDDDDLDDDDDDGRSSRRNDRRSKDKQPPSDDSEDEDDDDEDKSPEELRAELKRLRTAVKTAGKQTARQRERAKTQRDRIRELEGKGVDTDTDTDDDESGDAPTAKSIQKTISRAVRERERQLQDEHRRDLINTRAETALTRAGVSERNVRLLLKELDAEEIDFDPKTRSIDGLDEEIDRLKDEFPDLFRRAKTGRRRINGGDARDEQGRKSRPMTASERQAAQLRGTLR